MTKIGTKVIPFPKLRRAEQTGFTRKGFPARWLGLLLMTTVGAAWAINPGDDAAPKPLSEMNQVKDLIFTGEPQIVSQLMGAFLGPESTPQNELRSLVGAQNSNRRVVISRHSKSAPQAQASDLAKLLSSVEHLEGELSKEGAYPAVPALEVDLQQAGYRTDGQGFRLNSPAGNYSSDQGFEFTSQESPKAEFRVAGFLEDVTRGWGPFSREEQEFSGRTPADETDFVWLSEQVATPNWAARMYFPVDRKTTGYAFRRPDGSTIYSSGEFLYDGVSGTFQMKLFRGSQVQSRELSSGKLERELSPAAPGSEMVGDAALLSDLGLLKAPLQEDAVVHLSSPARLSLGASSALEGLAIATFSRHKKILLAADYSPRQGGAESAASAVGRMTVQDKLGQVHEMRLRAGRAPEYDWVVGQICPSQAVEQVHESSAYDEAFDHKTTSNVIAGK